MRKKFCYRSQQGPRNSTSVRGVSLKKKMARYAIHLEVHFTITSVNRDFAGRAVCGKINRLCFKTLRKVCYLLVRDTEKLVS